MQQHLAPRAIQTNGFSSEAFSVFQSILAGCKSSVALTRALLKRAITAINNKHSKANTKVFVDDTNMQSVSDTLDGTLEHIVPAVSMFGEKVDNLSLNLSPKAVISSSSSKLALILQKELACNSNMHFQVAEQARDVGVT